MNFLTLALLVLPAFVQSTLVSFEPAYDAPNGLLSDTACSDGENGLESRGYTTFGSLPKHPYIGGVDAIPEWNSPMCGTCWQLSYRGRTISVLAMDHTNVGFNIALGAMNVLTKGMAMQLGTVNATSKQVDASLCGLQV